MDANTVVSAVAAVVALAALGLTIYQTRLTHAHNRLSVQPVLQLGAGFRSGQQAGLLIRNVGLGPARIVAGEVWLDGRRRDEPFGKPVIDALRDALDPGQRRPSAVTFSEGAVLSTDYEAYLLSVVPYDKVDDAEFADLIGRLRIVIEYASLYGDRAVLDWTGER